MPLEKLIKKEVGDAKKRAISAFRKSFYHSDSGEISENIPDEVGSQKESDRSAIEIPPNLAESQKPRETRNSLAAIAGVSHGTLDKAKKIIESADEQTKERLRRGEMSIHRAYIELKQNDQKSDPATEDVPDSEKFLPKNTSPVSLFKKPVFEHYEPPAYMTPIPFEFYKAYGDHIRENRFVGKLASVSRTAIDREASAYYGMSATIARALAIGRFYNRGGGYGTVDLALLTMIPQTRGRPKNGEKGSSGNESD